MAKIRVLVQVGHETPRDPDPDLVNNTGAAGEVEVGRKVGHALVARLAADPRFRPRLIPGRVPADVQDGSFPVDAFIALHCDGGPPSAEGWSLGFPPDPVNKKLAQLIGREVKKFHRSDRRPDNNTPGMADYYGYRRVPTNGPEVLVEHGFVSNPTEREWLHNNAKRLARAEYRALLTYFELSEIESDPDSTPRPRRGGTSGSPPPSPRPIRETSKILADPRCSTHQLRLAVLARDHGGYSDRRVRKIIGRYVEVCAGVGVDPLVAVAQMVLETGNLSSFWSQPPRRNPAGIGVTGEPGVGLSFVSWRQAVRAHVGRLLAYAVKAGRETPEQLELVTMALNIRPLPDNLRGAAPTIAKLAGTWAADEEYAGKVVNVAKAIREA
jgi:hypothetical protein